MKYTIAALTFVVLMTGCAKKQTAKAESIADIQKREGSPITIIEATKGEIKSFDVTGGSVEGIRQATLVCNTPGIIESLFVSTNDAVKEGQPLLRIRPDIPSQLDITKSQYENAEKSLERIEALFKEGGASQEMLDQVRSGYTAAKAVYISAQKSEILASPFNGIVAQIYKPLYRNADRGNPLIDIASIDQVRIKMLVNESSIMKYEVGQVAYAISNKDTLIGKISLVSIAGSDGNHAFNVEAQFNNSGLRLRPGMFVSVNTIVEKKSGVVVLSMDAVIKEGKTSYVYAIEGGVAKKINITTGIRGGNYYEIKDGLKGGEQVVLTGSSALSDGMKVKIIK
jgi:RND family efflux transporter MFP subunit